MEQAKQQQQQHRGFSSFLTPEPAGGSGVSGRQPPMRLTITSTTGCPVELSVHREETAEGLRKLISQKLKLQTDRIKVVHKERHLTAGTLMEQGVTDGSKLTLVPVIETGSASSAREKTVMDTLESLTESEINDFLSGHLPLTLSLGAGAHTMYVQLQLSQKVRELQGNMNSMVQTRVKPQTTQTNNVNLLQSSSEGSSSPPLLLTDSTSFLQSSTQRPRSSFISSTSLAPESSINPSLVRRSQSGCTPPSPLHSTYFHNLPHAATPVCSSKPTGTEPGRLSPAPASTFIGGDVPEHQSKPPGAVIDSVISHSPGVFSGTFSGTLGHCSHGGFSHPRRGIAIILQIINDLLRAACHHQGALLPPLCNYFTPSKDSGSHLTAEEPCRGRNRPLSTQSTENSVGDESQLLHPSEKENKTLHCKMERLQLLMHQRRRRREIRRPLLVHGLARPNQHRRHRS
ncbi:midnolin-A-like isoform X1 [Girardinichthys multiradiatus]|uniref:midnolin-A-like isoform X1 n=1 Tax=Girardinichthys multiradiatus TaxID=208333 RepID=UPI001FABAC2C|nr:midnolin-A-like isoform X1 [Girardinichthys multiradiatus]